MRDALRDNTPEHGLHRVTWVAWPPGLAIPRTQLHRTTEGPHATCQGVLVDTRSGFILATAQGEGLREEHVLPGAVNIARDRVRREAQSEAIAALQKDLRATLASLAHSRGVRAE